MRAPHGAFSIARTGRKGAEMAEEQVETAQEMEEVQAQEPEAQAEPEPKPEAKAQAKPEDTTDWKAEARKWEDRAKANRKAQEAAEEALAAHKGEYESTKAELDALKAEKARAEAVRTAAKEHGVDADLLARMEGDVEENAKFLASRPKYQAVHDAGEKKAPAPAPHEIPTIF